MCGFFLLLLYEAADSVFAHVELHYLLNKSILLLLCNSSCDKLLATCKLLEKVPNKSDKFSELQN